MCSGSGWQLLNFCWMLRQWSVQTCRHDTTDSRLQKNGTETNKMTKSGSEFSNVITINRHQISAYHQHNNYSPVFQKYLKTNDYTTALTVSQSDETVNSTQKHVHYVRQFYCLQSTDSHKSMTGDWRCSTNAANTAGTLTNTPCT